MLATSQGMKEATDDDRKSNRRGALRRGAESAGGWLLGRERPTGDWRDACRTGAHAADRVPGGRQGRSREAGSGPSHGSYPAVGDGFRVNLEGPELGRGY